MPAQIGTREVAIGLMTAVLAALPFLATFAHRGYAPALLLLAPIVWGATRPSLPRGIDVTSDAARALLAAAAFSCLLLISCLWSQAKNPWKVWSDFTSLAAAGAVSAWLFATARGRIVSLAASALVIGVALALLLLAIEAATNGALRAALPPAQPRGDHAKDIVSLGRGVTAVLPSLFGAIAILGVVRPRVAAPFAIVAAVAAAAASQAFDITTNVVALVAALILYVLGRTAPRLAFVVLGLSAVTAILAAPLAAFIPAESWSHLRFLPASWSERLFIWREGGRAALACAPFGCGADYARVLSAAGETVMLPNWPTPAPIMPIHPHDIFLQVWMDLGAPGALIVMLFTYFGAAALTKVRLAPDVAGGAAALIALGLVSGAIEASLWQAWRIAAFGFGAASVALAHVLKNGDLRSHDGGGTGSAWSGASQNLVRN